jgi:hypothetical protein
MADDQYYYGEGGDDQYNAEGGICKVYDKEDGFTSLVQCLLAVIALGSLYVKRHHEIPKRKFMTWWLDVSKQGIGAVYAHVANMFIASIMSSFTRGDYVLEDQCAWYSISFITDTTVGLFFSLVFLGILNSEAKKRNWDSLMNTGVYEGPDGMVHWRNQLISWVIILTLVKFPVVFVMWALSPILSRAGNFFFQPMQSNIRFELLFVMIIFPGICNFFYFWIADHYLKAGPEHTSAHEPHDDAETGDYVATDDNGDVQRQAPDSQSFELPEVRLGSVRTLV